MSYVLLKSQAALRVALYCFVVVVVVVVVVGQMFSIPLFLQCHADVGWTAGHYSSVIITHLLTRLLVVDSLSQSNCLT
jgi:hypothetical protein